MLLAVNTRHCHYCKRYLIELTYAPSLLGGKKTCVAVVLSVDVVPPVSDDEDDVEEWEQEPCRGVQVHGIHDASLGEPSLLGWTVVAVKGNLDLKKKNIWVDSKHSLKTQNVVK